MNEIIQLDDYRKKPVDVSAVRERSRMAHPAGAALFRRRRLEVETRELRDSLNDSEAFGDALHVMASRALMSVNVSPVSRGILDSDEPFES